MLCPPGLKRIETATFLTAVLLLSLTAPTGAATLYVDLSNPAPVSPYTNWLTAATNIQDAVDAAVDGDSILVTNGVYASGGRVYVMTNRVAVTKPVTVQSVNGPEVTTIVGYQVPTFRNGAAAIRCVYLTNGAVLTGFTLTNGATTSGSSGGGVCCESASAAVSNCVITGSAASYYGGAAYAGTLYNCTLAGNRAGINGGGAHSATLHNCMLTGNLAGNGGGACNCTLNNCALSGNSGYGASGGSGGDGGGAYNSTLRNCTVTGNAAYFYSLPQGVLGPGHGAGTYGGTLYNCILCYNSPGGNYFNGTMAYCCTTPLPGGTGNTNVEPQLASLFHLSADSPCRGAGNSAYATGVDIDGEQWASPPLHRLRRVLERLRDRGFERDDYRFDYVHGARLECHVSGRYSGPGQPLDVGSWERDNLHQPALPCPELARGRGLHRNPASLQ